MKDNETMSQLRIPDGVECVEDIVYKQVRDEAGSIFPMKLDLYRAKGRGRGKVPLIMLIHGGCWCHQTKREGLPAWYMHFMGRETLLEDGWLIASVEYRKYPEGAPFPDQLYDCCDAFRFLVRHADEYGVDRHNLFVVGTSAGGYASAMLACERDKWRDRENAPELADVSFDIAAAVACSGVLDVPRCVVEAEGKVQANGDGRFLHCLRCLLSPEHLHDAELQRKASPRAYVSESSSPCMVVCGTADTFVPGDQSRETAAHARLLGLDWPELIVTGAEHNFNPASADIPTVPDAKGIYAAIRDFLRSHAR